MEKEAAFPCVKERAETFKRPTDTHQKYPLDISTGMEKERAMNAQLTAHYLANRYPSRVTVDFDCGHSGKKVKHHPDYGNPYNVELLCWKCHGTHKGSNYNFKYSKHLYRDKSAMLSFLNMVCSEYGDISRIAPRIGIPIVTLWRLVNGKYRGSAATWDAVYRYYGK